MRTSGSESRPMPPNCNSMRKCWEKPGTWPGVHQAPTSHSSFPGRCGSSKMECCAARAQSSGTPSRNAGWGCLAAQRFVSRTSRTISPKTQCTSRRLILSRLSPVIFHLSSVICHLALFSQRFCSIVHKFSKAMNPFRPGIIPACRRPSAGSSSALFLPREPSNGRSCFQAAVQNSGERVDNPRTLLEDSAVSR